MKIVKLTAENFMRLEAVDITPQGNAIMITGKNKAGKSSLIEAIKALFQGKKYHPEKPVREGADRAEIVGETENFIIKRTFTKAGGDSVTVTNAEGTKATSPQGLLEKFYGEIAFEPMAFFKDSRDVKKQREQLYTLMKLVGLDFADINLAITKIKHQRSTVKASKETYELEAGRIPKLVNMPTELVSMNELTEKLKVATQLNEKHATVVRQIDIGIVESKRLTESLSDNKQLIAYLKQKLANAERVQVMGEETLLKATFEQEEIVKKLEPLIDVTAINQEIADADAHNDNIRLTNQRKELLKKSAEKSQEFADLGKEVKALDAQKAERLAAVKMPIDGLSVNEETILFNDNKSGDIPLSQVNESMQLQIAVAISMALNPRLRVILMKGNDLDDENLACVCQMADEKDYQVWIEKVSDDKKNKTGFIIEDGNVVAAEEEKTLAESAAEFQQPRTSVSSE